MRHPGLPQVARTLAAHRQRLTEAGENDPILVWRRIGDHSIYRQP